MTGYHPSAQTAQAQQRYRELQISTATPMQRLLMVYDVAITACHQRNLKRATDALNVLRGSLNLEQGEVALRLYRLYQYCGDLAREGDYEQAGKILRELLEVWVQVLVAQGAPKIPQEDPPSGLSLVS